MARLLASLGLVTFLGSRADFVPFADVEELKPSALHPHCEQKADKDGHRWCRRSITTKLEDGGDVEMHWQMHVNPDNILSLDTEAQHGVRVTKCWPGELELEVPQSHESFVEAGKFIVGSSFVHGCHHYTDQHMYHRVKQVRSRHLPAEGPRTARFRVATETLPHLGHTARHVSFNFSYMPEEARDVQRFPKLRTDIGQHTEKGRRLGFSFPNVFGSPNSGGDIQSQGTSTGGIDTKNPVVNLSPKQISNFGWNWNFFMNQSQTPEFIIDKPGTKGKIIVKNPYVKVHSGCFINFSSDFQGFLKPPHVIWQAGMKGHGAIQGQLQGAINSTRSAESDPATYKVPKDVMAQAPFLRLLQKFDQPVWFSAIQQSVGNLPMKIQPGFQFQMSMYHKGPFEGWLAFGGRTHGTMSPILHFDSAKGFETTWQGELLDTDMWPPMWMVFTEAFEMGIKAEPKMLLKGDFMGFSDAQAAIQFEPYMNITVQRDGSLNFSADATKEMVVYPTRIMGISSLDFSTKYQVSVSCLGSSATSSPTINWGQVVFNDRSSTFSMGSFTDQDVEAAEILVSVYQIDSTGANTTLGNGTFRCASFSQGVCDPSPAFVSIKNAAQDEVAVVQLSIVHMENPVQYYGSQLKGVGVSFPSVDVNMVSLKQNFPSVANSTEPFTLHLVYTNRTYISTLAGSFQGTSAGDLTGTSLIELYPGFVENWDSCTGTGFPSCASPQVKLYAGSTLIAEGDAPPVDATAGLPPPSSNILASAGAAILGVQTTTTAPANEENKTLPQISLFAPGTNTAIGSATMSARVTAPQDSSFYMKPSFATQLKLLETVEFMWTVADANPNKSYSFTMTPLKIEQSQSLAGQDLTGYRKVDDQILMPVSGASQTVSANCEQRALGNLKASSMPCSFIKDLAFNGPTFMAGDYLMILTQWVEDGLTHAVYSPPFELLNSDGSAAAPTTAAAPAPALPAPATNPVPAPATNPLPASEAAPLPAPAADPVPAPAADPLPAPPTVPLPAPEAAPLPAPAADPVPAPAADPVPAPAADPVPAPAADPVPAPEPAQESSSSSSRRLEEHLEHVARLLEESATPYNVKQNVDDQAASCAKKDLKFNVGQGAKARGEILSMGVPKDFPYIAQNTDDGPMYSTPWFVLGPGTQPESDLEDMLPKEMCEAGLCNSVLPGCRQASFKKLHFPKLVFNTSRPYYYDSINFTAHGEGARMIKSGMSWAFSAMPEAIAVTLKQLEEEKKAQQAAVPNYFPEYNTGGAQTNTNTANSFNFGGYQPQASGQQTSGGASNSLNQFFSTQRRLIEEPVDSTARDQDGRSVEMPSKLESHQIRVEFPGGLPYIVNHQLVSLMMRHGYFQGLDDGHNREKGELKITGFYLQDGGSITIPVQGSKALRVTGAQIGATGLAGNKATGAWVAAASGLAVVSFAVVAFLRRSSHGYATPVTDGSSYME